MAGFKEGYLQLKKKDVGTSSDKDFIKFGIGTDFSPYTIDELGVKRSLAAAGQYQSTGSSTTPLPEFVDLGNGQCVVPDITCRLFSTDDFTGDIFQYNVSGTTLSFTENSEQYICIKYNSGSPIYYVENDRHVINDSSIILLYIVWRLNNVLHSVGMDAKALGLPNKTACYVSNTIPYKKSIDGGLFVTSNPSRHIFVTSAVVYAGIVPINVLPFNSTTDQMTMAFHVGGVWTYTDQLNYNFSQYDDGTDLQPVQNSKYSVRWFYRSIGDSKQVFYVLGSEEHQNFSEAKLETPRSDLPLIIKNHCVLVAKSIIRNNGPFSNGIIENISDVSFISTQVQNHNDLANIQGGSLGDYYHLTSQEHSTIVNLSALQEPTGFPNKNQVMVRDNTTFTISAPDGFHFFYRGQKFSKTSDSVDIGFTPKFVWYTSAGTLTATETPWDIENSVQVAYVYYSGIYEVFLGEERHGCVMDWATHKHFHFSLGTQYVSGFAANYTLNNASLINFGLTPGKIADEDLEHYIQHGSAGGYFTQPLLTSAQIPVFYRSLYGWTRDSTTSYPYKNLGGTGIYYNPSADIQTPVGNNNYVAYWIFATNNISEPIISVQGQREDTSLENAKLNAVYTSLNLSGFPTQEAKLLYRIILRTNTSYTQNIYRARIEDVTDYRQDKVNLVVNGGTGTVTYVGLSANPILEITNSPIVNAGTLTINFSATTSGTFLSGPISGNSNRPTFRKIDALDLPTLSDKYLPLSGGTLTGTLLGTNISAYNVSANYANVRQILTVGSVYANNLSAASTSWLGPLLVHEGTTASNPRHSFKLGTSTRLQIGVNSSSETYFTSYDQNETIIDYPIKWGNTSVNDPINITRTLFAPVVSANTLIGKNEVNTSGVFRSRLAGNFASIILNKPDAGWIGIGGDGSSNNILKFGTTDGSSNWTGGVNILVSGDIYAIDISSRSLILNPADLDTYDVGTKTPTKKIYQLMGINDYWSIYGEGGDNSGSMIIEVGDDLNESIKIRFKQTYAPYTTVTPYYFDRSTFSTVGVQHVIYHDNELTTNTEYDQTGLRLATNTDNGTHSFKPGIGFHSRGQYASLFYLNALQDWKARDDNGNTITFYHTGNLNLLTFGSYGKFIDYAANNGNYTYIGSLPVAGPGARQHLNTKIMGGNWTNVGECEVQFNVYNDSPKAVFVSKTNNNYINFYCYINGSVYDFYVKFVDSDGWVSFGVQSTLYDGSDRTSIQTYTYTASPAGSLRTITWAEQPIGDLSTWHTKTKNITVSGSYYVTNYAGGGTPALITNTGAATFYTLGLDSTAYVCETGIFRISNSCWIDNGWNPGYYYSAGSSNSFTIKGYGNFQKAGIYFADSVVHVGNNGDDSLRLNGQNIYIEPRFGYKLLQETASTDFGRSGYENSYDFTVYNHAYFRGACTIDYLNVGSHQCTIHNIVESDYTFDDSSKISMVIFSGNDSGILYLQDNVSTGKMLYILNRDTSGGARTIGSTVINGIDQNGPGSYTQYSSSLQGDLYIAMKVSTGSGQGGWVIRGTNFVV